MVAGADLAAVQASLAYAAAETFAVEPFAVERIVNIDLETVEAC